MHFKQELKNYLKDRSVAILGLGQSGIAAAKLLDAMGSKIFISDKQINLESIQKLNLQNRAEWENQDHSEKILNCDLIIVSPGIALNLPIFEKARIKKIPIWTELELAWRLLPDAKVATITGTNGKTTTVSLLSDMCKRDHKNTVLAGNIGLALSQVILDGQTPDIVILEVSSYQLEGIELFRPDVAVNLNLTNDHLQRHGTMQNYAAAKKRIFLNQRPQDFAILNADDPICKQMVTDLTAQLVLFSSTRLLNSGVFYHPQEQKIRTSFSDFKFDLPVYLPGQHNIENACAAIACALKLGISNKAIQESLAKFKGVEHRIETIVTINNVRYINDSKATNVDSTVKALLALPCPLWLILGGLDKGGSYEPIQKIIQERAQSLNAIKGIFLVGQAAQKIKNELGQVCSIEDCQTIEQAVQAASQKAQKGDTVLLSPACASFDQYKNYEERGRDFKNAVRKLTDHA